MSCGIRKFFIQCIKPLAWVLLKFHVDRFFHSLVTDIKVVKLHLFQEVSCGPDKWDFIRRKRRNFGVKSRLNYLCYILLVNCDSYLI